MSILYQPDKKPPVSLTILYSFQWLAFNLVNVAVVPLVVGTALGLNQPEIATLAQNTMFFASLASLFQVLWGHKLPIIEGPAGMWWGIFISLALMAPGMDKELSVLRTDLQSGVLISGIVLVILGLSGLMGRTLKLFTPAVTGTVLVLLTLQLSGSFVQGMLGISSNGDSIDPKSLLVSILVIGIIILVNLKGRGFIRSLAILLGTGIGWIVAVLIGVTSPTSTISLTTVIKMPSLFIWGTPTFDPGIIIICILTGLLVLSNLVASILAMERTLGIKSDKNSYDRGVTFTGIGDILAGLSSTVGVVPYSASAGLVGITGVGARAPFVLFAVLMMVMGVFPAVGIFLSSIPEPVGYSVLLASFCQMLGFGLKDYARLKLDSRDFFIIGLPLIIGTGILTLPASVFNGIPTLLRYIVGNGFILGMLLCILLEHVLLPKSFFKA